jgi:hypothetical protein
MMNKHAESSINHSVFSRGQVLRFIWRAGKKHDYPVIIGKDFWHRLTGDPDFYQDLLEAIATD